MGGIISDNWHPIIIFKPAFQLHDKTDNLSVLSYKRDAQGIIVIQQVAERNGSHGTIL
jgi:hypothetical protein